jgi:hypothetical protein
MVLYYSLSSDNTIIRLLERISAVCYLKNQVEMGKIMQANKVTLIYYDKRLAK